MTRIMLLLFTALTIGAVILTYYNVGLEETKYDEDPSVRSGSSGSGGGGYRYGK
ncbi:MAG: hypothetical protein R3F02_14475 [Thiolinea sp.]